MNVAPSWADAPLDSVLEEWDAVAFRWEIDADERLALLGVPDAGPIDEAGSYCQPGTERRMRLLVALDVAVAGVFGDEARTREWLRRSNMHLGDRAPIEVMARSPEWITWLIGALGAAA